MNKTVRVSKTLTPLRLYLHARHLRFQARAWLRNNEPAAIAAHCMFHLNRYARTGRETDTIYQLKNHLVRIFHQAGYCRSVRLHQQTLECWGCYGSGVYRESGDYEEICYKCGGTGIYRQHVLYAFHFSIAGRHYAWHQPQSLVTWPVRPDFAPIAEYQSPRDRYSAGLLPRPLLHLYAVTVAEYLVLCGVDRRHLPAFGPRTLRSALASAWRSSRICHRLHRARHQARQVWTSIPSAATNLRRLWAFAQTGEMPASQPPAGQFFGPDDDLPF